MPWSKQNTEQVTAKKKRRIWFCQWNRQDHFVPYCLDLGFEFGNQIMFPRWSPWEHDGEQNGNWMILYLNQPTEEQNAWRRIHVFPLAVVDLLGWNWICYKLWFFEFLVFLLQIGSVCSSPKHTRCSKRVRIRTPIGGENMENITKNCRQEINFRLHFEPGSLDFSSWSLLKTNKRPVWFNRVRSDGGGPKATWVRASMLFAFTISPSLACLLVLTSIILLLLIM